MTTFDIIITALVAALFLSVAYMYGRRALLISRGPRQLEDWARREGFGFVEAPEGGLSELVPYGHRHGYTGINDRLFDGISARPPLIQEAPGAYRFLLRKPGAVHTLFILEHRQRHGNPRQAVPRTAVGKAFGYTYGNLVGITLPRDGPSMLITPRHRMRVSLWVHRRLRHVTGDPVFDRRFGVLAANADHARTVLSSEVKRWLAERGVPAKTVLVLDGRVCYAATHEPVSVATLAERLDLVAGFGARLRDAGPPQR